MNSATTSKLYADYVEFKSFGEIVLTRETNKVRIAKEIDCRQSSPTVHFVVQENVAHPIVETWEKDSTWEFDFFCTRNIFSL